MGKNTVRKRKIHFHGNRYTKKQNIETQNEQEATSSSSRAKKLQDSINYSTSIVDELDQDDYYFYLNLFLNFKILKETLQPQGLLLSPECHQPTVNFVNNQEARIGFVNKLTISCDICDWEKNF